MAVNSLEDLPPLREVIAAHGLRADKALGQNFLLDSNITDKIARAAVALGGGADLSGFNVVEIGPGPGGLTRSLLRVGAKHVRAVEFDPRAIEALGGLVEAAGGRLALTQADALKTDILALVPAPRLIVANLPYNIATPLLTGWLKQLYEDVEAYAGFALMFQKEVADRITAAPGSKAYGRLSVLCQWLCDVKRVVKLPPAAFTPPPKVSSAVVRFKPRVFDDVQLDFEALEHVTAAAFGQRRKMIRSSLKDYLPALEKLGINPQKRAEELSVAEYIAIARGN